ncbi:MAG: FeoC-like transcriptional regulator [Alphaproteobacteria bacterium]
MAVPAKVSERMEYRQQCREVQTQQIKEYENKLQTYREGLSAIDAELAGISLAIEAYEAEGASGRAAFAARAPRRDIRGMVLSELRQNSQGASVDAIAKKFGLPPRQVRSALDYWAAKGDVDLQGDIAQPKQPELRTPVAVVRPPYGFEDHQQESVRPAAE